MSSSGKGQSKIDGPTDVEAAWSTAMAGGRVSHGRVIVEGFIDFDYEITLLTVRARAADGGVETRFCAPIGHLQVAGDYVESWQPHPMSPAALARARQIAKAVTDDLGTGLDGRPDGLGLFGVELFVKGDQVWFSEVSPRPHDTGMVTMITQWQSEFELHARAILGLPVDTVAQDPGRQRSDLRRRGRDRHRLRRRRRRAGRAGHRPAPVRQARELRQAPHGRGAGARHRRRGGPRQGQARRRQGQAARGLIRCALPPPHGRPRAHP
jgi:hypothetical protein